MTHETITLDGREYRRRAVQGSDGTIVHCYDVRTREPYGACWRTLSGHGRAYKAGTMRKLTAAFRARALEGVGPIGAASLPGPD